MMENTIRKKIIIALMAFMTACAVSYLIMNTDIEFDSFFLQMLFQFCVCCFSFCICYYCISYMQKCEKYLILCSGIFGILFSIGIVFGNFIRYREYVFEEKSTLGILLLLILFISIPSAWIFAMLTKLIEKFSAKAVENKEGTKSFALKVFAVIMLAWVPIWLAFFPCIYGYDIYMQLYSNVYLGNYSTFQPIIHTLFIRICFKVGQMVGSNVAGMALYSVIQMSALAGSITYALVYLKSRNVKGIKYYIAWFALYPFNPIMAISTTKDVFFSAAVLVVVVYSFKILVKKVSSWSLGGMVVFVSVMMLFRNNAIYAFLLALFISFFILKKNRKLCFIVGFSVIILTKVLDSSLIFITSAAKGPIVEMLCVPLQQLGRVGSLKGEEAAKEILGERAINNYNPALADSVKGSLDGGTIPELSKSFDTYLTMGMKYPGIYIDAFLANTAGYWSISDISSTEIYGKGLENRTGVVQLIHWNFEEEACNVKEYHLIPVLYNLYLHLFANNEYLNIPVFSFLFNMSIYTWGMIFYILFMIYKKNTKQLFPIAFLVGYFATLLLGPCALVRYMYPIMLSTPVFLAHCFNAENVKDII